MHDRAVGDTGPLRHLAEIGRENTLGLFAEVVVPGAVETELTMSGFWAQVSSALGSNLRVESVTQEMVAAARLRVPGFRLHAADLCVVALADRDAGAIILTDDLQLRRAVESLGRTAVGSVGILVRAYGEGALDRQELEAALDALCATSTLHLSRALRERIREILVKL